MPSSMFINRSSPLLRLAVRNLREAKNNRTLIAQGGEDRSLSPTTAVSGSLSTITIKDTPLARPSTRASAAQPERQTSDSPENEQKTGKKNSATQRQAGKSSNEMDKTIKSRVGKSGSRGRKSANGTPSRESSAGPGTMVTANIADMMRYLRQEDHDTRNDIEKAINSMAQAKALKYEAQVEVEEARKMGEQAKHTLEQFKMTALESHERALALIEEAKREKEEAVEAREEALRISNRLIEEQNFRSEVGSDACGL